MSELRVIVDQLVARVPGGIGRYTAELTRGLVETAPGGWDVVGVLSNSPETDRARIRSMIPWLSGLDATALSRRELSLAWSLGLARPRWGGAVHAPSLLAPVFRRGRRRAPGARLAVTIHDAVPWTHPETLTPHGVRWHRAMARRAERFADAIVVDTLDKIFEMLLAEVSKSGTPEEKLRDVVAAHMNFVIENRLHTKVVFEEATFLHERDFAGVRAKQRSIFDIYRRLVSNLINEGEVGDYDPAIAALNILGIIHGVYRWYDPERENSDKIVEQSLRLILDGLRVR